MEREAEEEEDNADNDDDDDDDANDDGIPTSSPAFGANGGVRICASGDPLPNME